MFSLITPYITRYNVEPTMKRLLLIEERYHNHSSLEKCLTTFCNLDIIKAVNTTEAIEIINAGPVDLIICDLSSGYGMLSESLDSLMFQFPYLPCIAITDPQQRLEKNVKDLGASTCLTTPPDQEELRNHILHLLKTSSIGTIHGIPLHSLLQLLESDEMTCTLQITNTENSGLIYLEEGMPIAAEKQDGLINEDAIYSIVVWDDVTITIRHYNCRRPRTIEMPLMAMIIEAFRLQDDKGGPPDLARHIEQPRTLPPTFRQPSRSLIPFECGAQITLETDHSKMPLFCTIAGILFDRFLMLSLPAGIQIPQYNKTSPPIRGRYFDKGKLFMFSTCVISELFSPIHLLFLKYPQTIEYREMRQARRISTFVPATLVCDTGKKLPGVLIDVSRQGCHFLSRDIPKDCFSSFDIDKNIEILSHIPGFHEKRLFRGKVKRIEKSSFELQIGIQFVNLPEGVKTTFDDYIISHL